MSKRACRHQLYRYYDGAGDLLYIGISNSAVARAAQHKGSSHWYKHAKFMEIENFKSREALENAETIEIQQMDPPFNVMKKISGGPQGLGNTRKTRGRTRILTDALSGMLKFQSERKVWLEQEQERLQKEQERLEQKLKEIREKNENLDKMIRWEHDVCKSKDVTLMHILLQVNSPEAYRQMTEGKDKKTEPSVMRFISKVANRLTCAITTRSAAQ